MVRLLKALSYSLGECECTWLSSIESNYAYSKEEHFFLPDSKTRQFKVKGEITEILLEFLKHGLVLQNDGKWQLSLKKLLKR